MIPDEAVDAAVKIIYGDAQEGITVEFQAFIQDKARAALEAAAPYMLASAWEQGWDAFASFDSRPGGPYPTNPYMRDTEGEK